MQIERLRQAEWLNARRVRAYAWIFLAVQVAGMIAWIALSDGLFDAKGKPIGTDFANVWSAGALAVEGRPKAAFDPAQHYEAQQRLFGREDTPFYGWHYPPMFLLVASGLALLPYLGALALWMAATLPLYLAAIRAIAGRREALLLALAFPGVMVNLGHGQNGFLTAGLMGAGLLLMKRRPILAGLCFGALTYKPQFGLLIPLVLAVTREWRVFTAAAATALGLAGLSYLAFGAAAWEAFFTHAAFTREVVLEAGGTGWHKIQSLFSAVRMWGGSVPLAYAAQILGTAIAAVLLVRLWRGPAPFALKAAGLVVAALLSTPYALDYDLVVLALPIAWLAAEALRTGFLPWERLLLAAAWLLPLVARQISELVLLPLGPVVMAALFWLVLRRAEAESAGTLPARAPLPAEPRMSALT
ncbi:MAG: glycosyltransferase family 87 protein [Kiloniellales bacterium]|nr:glycosyltransferase family 87 protein [Kiloniellales bacterium]